MKNILLYSLVVFSVQCFNGQEKDVAKVLPSTYPRNLGSVQPPSSTEVFSVVDQAAEFPGGMSKFRQKIGNDLSTKKIAGNGIVKSEAKFIVETDGCLTIISVLGENAEFNREIRRTLESLTERWTPAKINGFPVRSDFRLPLAIDLK